MNEIEKAQELLTFEYEQNKDKKLSECSDNQLRVKIAYLQWKDGADWPEVCEAWNDKEAETSFMIDFLTSTYSTEVNT